MARVKAGVPTVSELVEGETEYRQVVGQGVISYTKNDNQLYSTRTYPTSIPPFIDKKESSSINSIVNISTTGELELDFSALSSAAIANGDFIMFLDTTSSYAVRKEAVADVATLFAGAGMTATNSVLNVIAGTGIDATADAIAVDVSDFMASGVNNRVLTATGTDDFQGESGLTFVSDILTLTADSSAFKMGAGTDFTITHDGTTGATLAGNPVTITSGGAATWSTSAGNLTVDAAAAVLVLDGHTGITLDASNSGNIEINVTAADDILIGNDAVAQDILIGNAAATQVDLTAILVDINGGSSGVTIDGDVNINSYALTNSDPYTVSIKPNNSTQHMTMGLADKQNNYSMIGIYSAAAASIAGVSADSSFDNWPIP